MPVRLTHFAVSEPEPEMVADAKSASFARETSNPARCPPLTRELSPTKVMFAFAPGSIAKAQSLSLPLTSTSTPASVIFAYAFVSGTRMWSLVVCATPSRIERVSDLFVRTLSSRVARSKA